MSLQTFEGATVFLPGEIAETTVSVADGKPWPRSAARCRAK